MTDLASALATPSLGDFEGSDVIGVGVEIPNAGGGLHDAMSFNPVVLHKDEECYVLLRCTMKYPKFPPVKDTDCVRRVQVLHADEGTFVDATFAKEHIDRQREVIRLAKEKAGGIQRLGGMGEPDEIDEAEAMVVHHNSGLHAEERRDECPLCREEVDAEEREAAEDASGATPIGKGRRGRGKGQ